MAMISLFLERSARVKKTASSIAMGHIQLNICGSLYKQKSTVRKKEGLYLLKLSRYCTERSITKNSAMQVPRHRKNIFKNSLMIYLVIIVMVVS
jgi:hypothetical protein